LLKNKKAGILRGESNCDSDMVVKANDPPCNLDLNANYWEGEPEISHSYIGDELPVRYVTSEGYNLFVNSYPLWDNKSLEREFRLRDQHKQLTPAT
jgi:hypothetical protein